MVVSINTSAKSGVSLAFLFLGGMLTCLCVCDLVTTPKSADPQLIDQKHDKIE